MILCIFVLTCDGRMWLMEARRCPRMRRTWRRLANEHPMDANVKIYIVSGFLFRLVAFDIENGSREKKNIHTVHTKLCQDRRKLPESGLFWLAIPQRKCPSLACFGLLSPKGSDFSKRHIWWKPLNDETDMTKNSPPKTNGTVHVPFLNPGGFFNRFHDVLHQPTDHWFSGGTICWQRSQVEQRKALMYHQRLSELVPLALVVVVVVVVCCFCCCLLLLLLLLLFAAFVIVCCFCYCLLLLLLFAAFVVVVVVVVVAVVVVVVVGGGGGGGGGGARCCWILQFFCHLFLTIVSFMIGCSEMFCSITFEHNGKFYSWIESTLHHQLQLQLDLRCAAPFF